MRLLFYLVVGYLVWKIVQFVVGVISAPPRGSGNVFTQPSGKKKSETFKDIKDADFEELPPDDKK